MGDEDPTLVGDELGAELGDLYRCGVVSMPNLAGHFRTAGGLIPGEELDWAYRRATDIGLTASGPNRQWRQVADVLVGFMLEMETSLTLCGEAMVRAADDYASADAEAAAAYESLRAQADRDAEAGGP